MVDLWNCYLQPNSNLEIVEKNGNVIGFTLKDNDNKKIIYLNDSFLCLEELPQEKNGLSNIEFVGLTYLPEASSFVFCKVNLNRGFKDCHITTTCNSYNDIPFNFNKFVEPKRVAPYTYIIGDNCNFPDGNELSNISLFNVRTGSICSIGRNIKRIFDNSPLIVLYITLVPMDNDIHRLEIVLGDRKTLRAWDTIYMGLKVIDSKNQGITYQVCNNFYNKNYTEDGFYLESKSDSDVFFSKISFLNKLGKSNFIKELENEVNRYHNNLKKRILN